MSADAIQVIRRKFEQLSPVLGERALRLWAGAEADAAGNVALVAKATGIAISTVRIGRDEVRVGASSREVVKERRRGAGRKPLETLDPGLLVALERLVDPATRGHPESPLRWTSKSATKLAAELTRSGHPVSASKVAALLNERGYSLQSVRNKLEGESDPDRDAQFEHISTQTKEFIARKVPVVSVDTKKKESIGNFVNRGREWQPKGEPVEVLTYDFTNSNAPKAIPYGVYDVGDNKGFVNVGTDHDTPMFAVHSLERWWNLLGSRRYPNANELFITADAGGSNARKSNGWKAELQAFADRTNLTVHVSHYPPGTSKWNKIEHRLFSFITLNWRGKPLVSYETAVLLIAGTTTSKGLCVTAELDEAKYPTGIKVQKHVMRSLHLERGNFRGEWNYILRPRTEEHRLSLTMPDRHKPPMRTQAQRRERWLELFREQATSGQTHRQYCLTRGIHYDAYLFARRNLVGVIRKK